MPDFGHIVPVVDDTVFDGIGDLEDTLFGDGFFSNIGLFIIHSDHDVVVFGSSDDGGER